MTTHTASATSCERSRRAHRSSRRNVFLRIGGAIVLFAAFVFFSVDAFGIGSSEDSAVNETGRSWYGSDANSSENLNLQFRVDSVSRFIRNERVAKYSSSSVFCDDMAFDFVGDNGEIVIYSFRFQKFTLIDPIRRIRTEIDESEVDRFIERIKTLLRNKDDGFSVFMTKPSFEVSEKENEYFFQSKWIDYRVTTSPMDDEQVADVYFRFLDAMGKLNVYLNPGVITPLARMEANRKCMQDSRFPEKVVSEIYPKGKNIFTKTYQVENESSLSRRISDRDRNRVNRAAHFFEQFPFVSFKTYVEKTGGK